MLHLSRSIFRSSVLVFLTLVALVGCSHTIKMYDGSERDLSRLAFVYPHAGADPIGIRYLNDKRIPLHTAYAVVHALPGPNKLTLVHFNTTIGSQVIIENYVTT